MAVSDKIQMPTSIINKGIEPTQHPVPMATSGFAANLLEMKGVVLKCESWCDSVTDEGTMHVLGTPYAIINACHLLVSYRGLC